MSYSFWKHAAEKYFSLKALKAPLLPNLGAGDLLIWARQIYWGVLPTKLGQVNMGQSYKVILTKTITFQLSLKLNARHLPL